MLPGVGGRAGPAISRRRRPLARPITMMPLQSAARSGETQVRGNKIGIILSHCRAHRRPLCGLAHICFSTAHVRLDDPTASQPDAIELLQTPEHRTSLHSSPTIDARERLPPGGIATRWSPIFPGRPSFSLPQGPRLGNLHPDQHANQAWKSSSTSPSQATPARSSPADAARRPHLAAPWGYLRGRSIREPNEAGFRRPPARFPDDMVRCHEIRQKKDRGMHPGGGFKCSFHLARGPLRPSHASCYSAAVKVSRDSEHATTTWVSLPPTVRNT